MDDCSDGSVLIVLCSSVSELRISDENVVCVNRVFVDNVPAHFILYVLMKFNQLVEALWLGCHCNWDYYFLCGSTRCVSALFCCILSVTVRVPFPASCQAAGYK